VFQNSTVLSASCPSLASVTSAARAFPGDCPTKGDHQWFDAAIAGNLNLQLGAAVKGFAL